MNDKKDDWATPHVKKALRIEGFLWLGFLGLVLLALIVVGLAAIFQ